MRATRILHRGRRLARDLMDTTVTVRRETGAVWDEETGQDVPELTVIYTTDKARIRFPGSQPQERDAAGQRVVEQSPTLALPVEDSGGVRENDIATVDANPQDPSIVGMQMRVAGQHNQSHSTSRRLPVEVISRG